MPAVVVVHEGSGLGTGFVVRPDGWIATNFHVIAGATKVTVTLRDGRNLDVVDVLASSPDFDLALLRVDAQGLATVTLGDSQAMRPGDPVVAIGNPLGLEDTVSSGLISARRTIHDGAEVLQISAPIAHGSSGGPIFNDRGEVIGIATAFMRDAQNINFGVPARYLVPLMARPHPIPIAQFAAIISKLLETQQAKEEPHFDRHPMTLLDGCPAEARLLVAKMISEAIEVGAPLFNEGRPDACYHVYDGAASDIARKLPPTCRGPARALAGAQTRAATTPGVSAQAWVMRNEFDALLDVIGRKAHGAP
jgi:hypothetical protein